MSATGAQARAGQTHFWPPLPHISVRPLCWWDVQWLWWMGSSLSSGGEEFLSRGVQRGRWREAKLWRRQFRHRRAVRKTQETTVKSNPQICAWKPYMGYSNLHQLWSWYHRDCLALTWDKGTNVQLPKGDLQLAPWACMIRAVAVLAPLDNGSSDQHRIGLLISFLLSTKANQLPSVIHWGDLHIRLNSQT